MGFRSAISTLLVVTLTTFPLLAQEAPGIIGRATDEAKKPYSDYTVQLRDVSTGQMVSVRPLDAQGLFSFGNLDVTKRYLVELFSVKRNRVVCSEGPFGLTPAAGASSTTNRPQVNIDCGATPAALWLLVAGAGTAAAITTTAASPSQ